ncbi:UDP-N-acetylmuramoyl-tripeptide--D-alanyl-D-alanine ligase [Dysgonomonas sp. PFB1-18]|uniref:UDP-N-acetylmuramoyl-tripeptide--D-alanyl-D- alanine ligase n=1 Tax=unclassified Dysgonomonas TaxID=2630389 RepID=UPI002473B30A|nr:MULTISPECIES: UDP-N-acetylmuramoyl-tripeptide--D-alanyl-D-alanine ligase [unclassified Dysgonomonas]MDL2303353.1 UDP-N-acetylmuramoyl-tripeptide--D-alanyl-D-alanine ligase [Dysgonomonas sp. OttesenSCG-928-D17]MDH6308986.1 UDP-N-acetylmuramoyl-tripeptide--D-alanyl-D-alanine ligase [Dysgonomonas sp. PF1-14]MDH6338737.1 UDP-N-acetylmuramoyl-tripeptide--D-alanyl-D-alanine ligase [Dysgonomonas sp. PF1-16]MDH6380235.1 UDP-N-acetylmuramoyl-tripeptide--D-alanyl-D-alanine ligase [Dysgonomonas sp. PFB
MEISELYKIYKQHPEVSTDTRNAPKGSIFFALKGANFNGNEYAEKAIDSGCSYAVVDEAKYVTRPNIILVDNALETLQELARHHRKQFKTPVIGITGTNGKTTTKELITSVLSQEYNVLSTQGNLNNHIGVPLTILRIKKEHEIAIIEMGASHVEEIKFLSEIAQPNYGLITNIGHAHIEGFGSYENVIKAKGELYEYIRSTRDGKIFIDFDNSLLREMAEGITSIYYGFEEDLFVSGRVISIRPYLEFEWKFGTTRNKVKTKLIGEYNLPNILAAITVGKYLGVKASLICKAIESYEPTNNRSQLKETNKNMLIIDAYNANPTSMHAALENFDHMDVNHKVLILGDMKELGADTDVEHQKVADYISHHNFEKVLFVGDNFSRINTDYPRFKDMDSLKDYLISNPIEDSYILLKGSRGIQLERCIDML